MPPTRRQLLKQLKALAANSDPDGGHREADRLLLDYLNDPAITKAFDAIEKWYS